MPCALLDANAQHADHSRVSSVRRRSLEMKVDPEQHQGPEQYRKDCRGDRLDRVEMHEVVMRRRHDHADDEIDQAEHETDKTAQKDPPSVRS